MRMWGNCQRSTQYLVRLKICYTDHNIQQRLFMPSHFTTFVLGAARFLPSSGVHSFLLQSAVKRCDADVIARLATPKVVENMSARDQRLLLSDALDQLVRARPDAQDNARNVVQTLLQCGVRFCDGYDGAAADKVWDLLARKEYSVLQQLCSMDLQANSKLLVFAEVVRKAAPNEEWIVRYFYNMWSDTIKGTAVVCPWRWTREKGDNRTCAPTLFEVCCKNASETTVLKLLFDCPQVSVQQCAPMLKRAQLSVDTVAALAEKGLDVHSWLEWDPNSFGAAFVAGHEYLKQQKARAQRTTLEQAVEGVHHNTTAVVGVRRKM